MTILQIVALTILIVVAAATAMRFDDVAGSVSGPFFGYSKPKPKRQKVDMRRVYEGACIRINDSNLVQLYDSIKRKLQSLRVAKRDLKSRRTKT